MLIYKWLPKKIRNRYFVTGLVFVVWLAFFDDYNFIFHSQLISKKSELEKEYYRLRKETYQNRVFLNSLNDPEFLERYARERFLMQKENEDVFIIEKNEE